VPRGALRSPPRDTPSLRSPARRNARGGHDQHRGSLPAPRHCTTSGRGQDVSASSRIVVGVCDGASGCGRSGHSGPTRSYAFSLICGCLLMWRCPRSRPCQAPPTTSGGSPHDQGSRDALCGAGTRRLIAGQEVLAGVLRLVHGQIGLAHGTDEPPEPNRQELRELTAIDPLPTDPSRPDDPGAW
jgi:hypothetical protein